MGLAPACTPFAHAEHAPRAGLRGVRARGNCHCVRVRKWRDGQLLRGARGNVGQERDPKLKSPRRVAEGSGVPRVCCVSPRGASAPFAAARHANRPAAVSGLSGFTPHQVRRGVPSKPLECTRNLRTLLLAHEPIDIAPTYAAHESIPSCASRLKRARACVPPPQTERGARADPPQSLVRRGLNQTPIAPPCVTPGGALQTPPRRGA